jgi:hypothetical protein
MAMTDPGMFLSQPGRDTLASYHCSWLKLGASGAGQGGAGGGGAVRRPTVSVPGAESPV